MVGCLQGVSLGSGLGPSVVPTDSSFPAASGVRCPLASEKHRVRAESRLRGRQISIDAFASGGFGTGFVSPPRVGAAAAAAASPITRSVCGPLTYAASRRVVH